MVELVLADMFAVANLSHVCATVCSALQITSVRELARYKVFQCAPDAMYAIVWGSRAHVDGNVPRNVRYRMQKSRTPH
jgi:hypothetical protein